MDDLLRDFLTETSENIAIIDVEIVRLEQNPNDYELLSSIFRLVHTIKGTCGFLGLPRLEHVAHAGENILGKFRDGELSVTPQAVSLILKSMDTIKNLLSYLEQNEKEPEGSDQELIAELNAMASSKSETPQAAPTAPPPVAAPPQSLAASEPDEFGFVPVPAAQTGMPTPPLTPEVVLQPSPPPPAPQPIAAPMAKPPADDHGNKGASVADQSIRVSVDQLEKLMTTVSELVLTRNQLLQILRGQKDSTFLAPLERLNQVTSELQEGVMKTRMQPIGNAWSKLPRIIRDLSHELGKKIDLQMIGADTELDRQVLELIKDPLTHMVRNSADHGIELPADRVKAGKPETGAVILNAYHEGGHIILQISDDGRGLALDKIRSKVLEKKLATEAELAGMPDQQIMQFIFKPGFSTAAQVTSVSGRGVGMDVVKTNIEKIGGTVDFQSTQGKGSRFFIKIPLTLAIVSALIVECKGERYAIPQINVVELVQVSATSEHQLEHINDTPVLRLRNRLLTLISLRKALNLIEEEPGANEHSFIVVIQTGHSTFGIIVDRVFDTEEIVVKPVSPILRDVEVFSGNTILGDGSVVMILDPNGIVTHAGASLAKVATAAKEAENAHVNGSLGKQSLLLFNAGEDAPKVVPLSLVTRLEQLDCSKIEFSNGSPVIQYRGKLMPLVPVSPNRECAKQGTQTIVVFTDEEKNMGLFVDSIIDIVEEKLQIDLSSQRPGFLGTSIISGRSTDVIDAAYYLSRAFDDWFSGQPSTVNHKYNTHRILLVDDSSFFRNLLTPFLEAAGYHVTTVMDAVEALKLREAGEAFDIIISDIEMPGMNGFEFAAAVRGHERWKQTPMIALSSHATAQDKDRGESAGFSDYVTKFDRNGLLATLQQNLAPAQVNP